MKTWCGKEGQEVSERLLEAEQEANASHPSNLAALSGIRNTASS